MNELEYLFIHFICGSIGTIICAVVQYREKGELVVADLAMLWIVALGPAGLLLCLIGIWSRWWELNEHKTLLARKPVRKISKSNPPKQYKIGSWK